MLILITGGSGSGKSAYAEDYITKISKKCRKYYIATMQVFDREGQEKIKRHRSMRSGKGFQTVEQPLIIEKALEKMEPNLTEIKPKIGGTESNLETVQASRERTALLECMSNLVANEMFSEKNMKDSNTVMENIIQGVEQLNQGVKHLVIVTNNVFEDGITYDETTMEYIRAMGGINEKLAAMADKVIEVVVGIPIIVKEGN